jgi:hypothetical protein
LLDIKKIVKVCSVQKFGSQEIIFEEGDPGEEMFIILSGSARVLISGPDGNKVEIALLKAGDIFGEMSLLQGLPRSATIQVLEETTTVAINESNFEYVIIQEPSLAMRIMKSLSERLRRKNAELTKNRELLYLNAQLSDAVPQTTIEEIKAECKLEKLHDSDDFAELIQYVGRYSKVTHSNHSEYLFDKKIQCPICDQTINVQLYRSSKLRVKQIESDYRQIYTDFDPLWYIVWVCPHCCYANFSSDFMNISERERERIKAMSSTVKETFSFRPSIPLSLTQVFTGYYLMLHWYQQLKIPSTDLEKLGKIWLRISWLYFDVQEMEMFTAATGKALDHFLNLLNDIKLKTTAAQDQYLYLLVGELSLKLGNSADAKGYFYKSIGVKGGNVRMKQQAQDRIQEMK